MTTKARKGTAVTRAEKNRLSGLVVALMLTGGVVLLTFWGLTPPGKHAYLHGQAWGFLCGVFVTIFALVAVLFFSGVVATSPLEDRPE